MKALIKKLSSIRKFYAVYVLFKRIVVTNIDKFRIRLLPNLHINDNKLLRMTGCASKAEAVQKFRHGLLNLIFFKEQDFFIKEIASLSDLKNKTINNAEQCLNNRFFLFERFIDHSYDESTKHYKWDMDLFAQYKYEPAYYTEVRKANTVKGVDIKLPWELSRMQFLLFLAQAFLITKDEKYSMKIVNIIKDWIECNPPKVGVNWHCTMDVGLRIANMVVAIAAIKDSNSMDDNFVWMFMKSCVEHGKHIRANLENISKAKCNHYLSDIFGLLCLSAHVTCFKESKKWFLFSSRKLFKEIEKQVFPDGMDYEGSTSYHRLVCELFYFAALICIRSDIKLPANYLTKLDKMAEFIKAITKSDAHIPQIGDNDSGRVFIFSERHFLDHRYMIDLIFKETRSNFIPAGSSEELFWIYGLKNYNKCFEKQKKYSNDKQIFMFPDSKIAVYKDKQLYLIVSAISNNHAGIGGHTHNDKLSFELQYKGKDFFIDPGTGAYTPFPDIRNKFRSTYSHNTVVVNKMEQCAIDASLPFVIDNKTLKTNLNIAEKDKNTIIITGNHNGYAKKLGIEHFREFQIQDNSKTINIIDTFTGTPQYLQWNFVLAPEVTIEKLNPNEVILINEDCHINFIAPYTITIFDGMYSRGYYQWIDTKIIKFETAENCSGLHSTVIKL